eukprot:8814651-Ditylum_brightwellii.AAC.1
MEESWAVAIYCLVGLYVASPLTVLFGQLVLLAPLEVDACQQTFFVVDSVSLASSEVCPVPLVPLELYAETVLK